MRLTAGKSCLFLKLVAGEASPAPPGRGLRPLPSPLRGLCPLDPRTGGGVPPTPLLRTETLPRVKAKTRQQRGQKNHRSPPRFAALKRRARRKVLCQAFFQESGGAWPHRTSRLLACGKGGKRHTAARRKHANARKRYTRPSVSERPKARRKVLCQAFFQESGGERSVTGAGPSGEILPGPSWTSWPPRRTPRPGASRAPSAAGQIQPFPLAARRSPRGCK